MSKEWIAMDKQRKIDEAKSKEYQTYLKDCDCSNGGIIIYKSKPVCRWCRTPYYPGSKMMYKDIHFKVSQNKVF